MVSDPSSVKAVSTLSFCRPSGAATASQPFGLDPAKAKLTFANQVLSRVHRAA